MVWRVLPRLTRHWITHVWKRLLGVKNELMWVTKTLPPSDHNPAHKFFEPDAAPPPSQTFCPPIAWKIKPRPLGTARTSLNSRGRLSVGCSSAALRYNSLAAPLWLSWTCGGGSSCSGWYMGGGRVRWRGHRGSADWPRWTVCSHGTSFRPGHDLNRIWLASWRMSRGGRGHKSRPDNNE